jgi:hypothetical protein
MEFIEPAFVGLGLIGNAGPQANAAPGGPAEKFHTWLSPPIQREPNSAFLFFSEKQRRKHSKVTYILSFKS